MLDIANSEIHAAIALLEAQIEGQLKDSRVPGLSIAVVHDRQILFSKGFGHSNLEKKISATSQTLYNIGSITKLFTATMLMQLRDSGTLLLDEPLDRHLPALKFTSSFGYQNRPTFRQIASHTSGLSREISLDSFNSSKFPSIDELLENLGSIEFLYPPMTRINYSNLGYALLGHTLEGIAGQPYEDYIVQHIFQPLSMNSSGFKHTPYIESKIATGYIVTNGKLQEVSPNIELRGYASAGQMYTSVEDIAQFISLQFQDGPVGGTQILNWMTLAEMRAPIMLTPDWKNGTAIGWHLGRLAKYSIIGHPGRINGYFADIKLIPDIKLGIAILTNSNIDIANISMTALELLIPIISRVSARNLAEEIVESLPSWRKYTGRYQLHDDYELVITIDSGKLKGRIPYNPPYQEVTFVPVDEYRFLIRGGPLEGEIATFATNEMGNVSSVKLGDYLFNRI